MSARADADSAGGGVGPAGIGVRNDERGVGMALEEIGQGFPMGLPVIIAFAHQDAAARFKLAEVAFEAKPFRIADPADLKEGSRLPAVEPGQFRQDGEAGDDLVDTGRDSGPVQETALLLPGVVAVVGEKKERRFVTAEHLQQLRRAGNHPRPVNDRAVDIEQNRVEPDRFSLPEINQSHHGFLTDTILPFGEFTICSPDKFAKSETRSGRSAAL
ncbi:hypothetical protein SDC9_148984 [bioreactor metagenome]|uniref:Uncharacterized protein n=1 Tax=bioreactor metagenome TaxID=1076179 RepID=A0A645EKH7_9ZZZZ